MTKDLSPIHALVEEALTRGDFPGASLLIARGEDILLEQAYGAAQTQPSRRELTLSHLFDLASLTKPMATATLFMLAVQEGRCRVDKEAEIPGVTLTHLLNHTSGLPDWKPLYENLQKEKPEALGHPEAKQWIVEKILEEPLISRPGTQCLYSDLGYIILGDVLEKIHGIPLDALFEAKIARPLGLKNTFYQNLQKKRVKDENKFAATENCLWRRKTLSGEVMDDNAWAMGGVAGHAGLFSTVHEVFIWLRELGRARAGLSHFIHKDVFDAFTRIPPHRDPHKRFFTLGFDTPSHPSSSGQFFSPNSLGHLGYAGTSFWWDTGLDLKVILLTNRVHPLRTHEAIKAFRPRLHDLIFKTLFS